MHDLDLLRPGAAWAMVPRVLEQQIRALNGTPLSEVARFDAAAAHAATQAGLALRGAEALPGTLTSGRIGSVAVVPVQGTVFPSAPRWWWSSAAVLDVIRFDVEAALASPEVSAIVLDVNSPGGMVTGTEAFSDWMHSARGRKPIVAHSAGGMIASAALWIASATDQIVIDRTAEVGSVGAVMTFVDWTRFDERIGIREIDIISSQSPKKRMPPTTEEGRALAQTRVDRIADVFVDHLSRNRGVSRSVVLSEYGAGAVLVGDDAVAHGLADRISTFDELIADLDRYGKLRSA